MYELNTPEPQFLSDPQCQGCLNDLCSMGKLCAMHLPKLTDIKPAGIGVMANDDCNYQTVLE